MALLSIFKNKKDQYVRVTKKSGKILFETKNCFQSRGVSTEKMLTDALKLIPNIPDFDFYFFTDDFPVTKPNKGYFYYCSDNQEKRKYTIPDHVFGGWPEAGINNYTSTVQEIVLQSAEVYTDKRIFWIGNTKLNPKREKLISLAEKFSDVLDVYDTRVDAYFLELKKVPYFSLPEHTKYKYLIDLEGRGYSGRLKLFMFSKRLIFLEDRKWKEFFHYDLKPNVHFIPVKSDLSDLINQYNYIEQNPNLYNEITNNAFEFAMSNLTYNNSITLLSSILLKSASN